MDEIKEISIKDENYPKLLKEIKNPPKVIYFRGEILPRTGTFGSVRGLSEENCFALVGTRMCSDYGKEIALEMAGDLAESGLTVVSGLAPGIDTFVHQAVVERKKRTIAVLGTGVDEKSIYPQSNLKLAQKIIETGGCLISEYPAGTRGTQFTFPQRNRIISGLSLGVLVIEAKEKSGALITTEWAKKQGRKVFAVPGPIHSLNSRGPHSLLKNGAKLVENANDILNALNLKPSIFKTEEKGENEEESLILNILKEGSSDIDKIIEETKLPAPKVASTLAILEIKDKVRNLGGNIYVLFRK